MREYLAIPEAAEQAAFEPEEVDRAFTPRPEPVERCKRIMVLDPSSGKRDVFAYAVCGWNTNGDAYQRWPDGTLKTLPDGTPLRKESAPPPPTLTFDLVGGFEPGEALRQHTDLAIDRLVAIARQHGVTHVVSDQREALMIGAACRRHGLTFTELTYTAASKAEGVEVVRRWLAQGELALPKHDRLRAQMHAYEQRFDGGKASYGARGTAKDDFASLAVTAALAELKGLIPGTPNRPRVYRGVRTEADFPKGSPFGW